MRAAAFRREGSRETEMLSAKFLEPGHQRAGDRKLAAGNTVAERRTFEPAQDQKLHCP